MTEHNKVMCEVCGTGRDRCVNCGSSYGLSGTSIARWILGIIIITWVFSIGMKIGEVKGALDVYGYSGQKYYRSMPMMTGPSGTYLMGGAPAYTPGDIAR